MPILLRCRALTQKPRSLNFIIYDELSAVQRFSDAVSGPFQLFHTPEILAADGGLEEVNFPFFGGAVNLRVFSLFIHVAPYLDRFVFPNLTTFKLSADPNKVTFPASELLDFLRATPTLCTVCSILASLGRLYTGRRMSIMFFVITESAVFGHDGVVYKPWVRCYNA